MKKYRTSEVAKMIVLLEGTRLVEVSEGIYFSNAALLNVSGTDGSPCKAVLIADER